VESKPTVYVVDDDQAIRDSLTWLLESANLPVRTMSSCQEFLEEYDDGPGCLILDIRMPGMTGLELQEELNRQGTTLPVIIITGHGDVPVAVRAMKAGAFDFVEKPFSDDLLLDRVHAAIELDADIRGKQAHHSEIAQRIERLTPREREVMDLVVSGLINKQIAAQLSVSPKTVEVHRAHVMQKMEASSVAELVRMAMVVAEADQTADEPGE